MLLQKLSEDDLFGPLREMRRIQNQLNKMLSAPSFPPGADMPPLKVFSSESSVVVCAEIPGLDPQDIEISLLNDTLIIRGERKPEIEMEAHSCHRQERCFGRFSRSLQLPYAVEAEQVQARFSGGLLQITLPRAEAAKPRKINVVSE